MGPIAGLLAALLAAQELVPAPTFGQIVGRVLVDETQQPLADVRVFLYPIPFPEGGRPASTRTDRDGGFVFTQVEPGAYRLGTNKLGFYGQPGGISSPCPVQGSR